MKMKKRFLSFLLSLVMVLGLVPGMSLTAYADGTYTVTFKANGKTVTKEVTTLPYTFSCDFDSENGELDQIIKELYGISNGYCRAGSTPSVSGTTAITAGNKNDSQYFTITESFTGTAMVRVYYSNSADFSFSNADLEITCQAPFVAVTGVSLSPSTSSSKAGDTLTLTATVSPDNATNKKVKWSVGGGNAGAVALYSDADCKTPLGTDATKALTVYAKCNSVGSAVVTAASDEDGSKTAACSVTVSKGENPLTYPATQTVSKTFSTSAQTAALTAAENGQGNVTYAINSQKDSKNADVNYFTLDGTTLTLAENTPAGTYTVVVCATAAGNENYNSGTKDSTVTVTVSQADNPVTYAEKQTVTKTFSTATQTATLEAAKEAQGELSYSIKSQKSGEEAVNYFTLDGTTMTLAANTPVGTYTVVVYATAAGNDNYNSGTKDSTVTVIVNKADASRDVPEKALPYTGQSQELVTAGTVSGGTLQYALGKDDVTAPTDGWSTEIPTATEPGTYYVWYRIKGDANHNDVAPACVVVTMAEPTSQETPPATPAAPESVSDYTLLASMKTSGNKAFKLKWTAVTGAEGYDVFLGDCGGGECTLEKTVTGQSCKIGKLKKGNAYKAFVKAWRTENGQKVYIGEASPDVHAVAGGKSNKYTNAKKITVKKKKLTVAVGASKKIKASLKKFSNSRRYLNHTAKIRYYSSNRAVATVNAKGKVTGVAPGTCTVYAVAENGLRKGVKITVK